MSNLNNKHSKNNHQKILFGLMAIALVLASLFIVLNIVGRPAQKGQLLTNSSSSGQNLHHSLDLQLASRQAYPSAPLETVETDSTASGIERSVVRFNVTADHLKEFAYMMKPTAAPPPNGFPVVIICHGYVNPAEYETANGYLSDMEFYAKAGYLAIKPDFRGQGLSAGQGIPEGAYYSMAYNTDLMSLISALKDTQSIDRNNINLWGHSMGAYIALRTAVVSADIKHLILLSGPVGSLKQIYLSYVPPSDENNEDALRIRNEVFSKYGTPGEGSDFWDKASPSSYLAGSKVMIQIHVGTDDQVVPNQLSKDLDTSLTNLHKPHEYYLYDGARHGLLPQRPVIWSRSLAFLNK